MTAVGIIPARGGSKAVPRKNIRMVGGAPLIAYSILAAQQSCRLTAFATTTDDSEVAEVALRYACHVIERPPELAQDNTPMVPVLVHALDAMERQASGSFDIVVLLQPSSPIRTGVDIDNVILMLEEDPQADSIISVAPVDDNHPARMYLRDDAGWLSCLYPQWETARRQDLPEIYHRNGALYACRRAVLVEQRTLLGTRRKAYVMSADTSVNIDREIDLVVAERLIQHEKQRSL